jgi:2-haloacid dehalogenase
MTNGRALIVVFDLGAVLLDWDPRYLYRKLFDDNAEMEYFLNVICTREWHHAHNLGEDAYESCERLAALHPNYRDKILAWATRGEEMLAGQIDDTVALLKLVKSKGIPCYTLTNMEARAFSSRRERFEFIKWFDGFVVSGYERIGKPDPRFFAILFRRYNLDPRQCIFIDDRPRNVAVARELGMNSIQYVSAAELRLELLRAGLEIDS